MLDALLAFSHQPLRTSLPSLKFRETCKKDILGNKSLVFAFPFNAKSSAIAINLIALFLYSNSVQADERCLLEFLHFLS